MEDNVDHIVILGGGTAGWLSACLIAAHNRNRSRPLQITLIQSPDIPTVGVGEGTWPTMRQTLSTIGISEGEFLARCNASFKQGSRFDGWADGTADDSYLHPFTAPPPADISALLAAWRTDGQGRSFADMMTAQAGLCARNLSPRQPAMPDYAGAANYAYHLDAGAFAALLSDHATKNLGVRHVADQVVEVVPDANGDIAALRTRDNGDVAGDLFIDCSGHAAMLIGGHYGVEWVDRSAILFNDRALAAQIPVLPDSPIASQTIATAHEAGWIWDIGLPGRRGIGCVYSSRHMDDGRAETVLRRYIGDNVPGADAAGQAVRLLKYPTGYRRQFWRGNCIAIGLSAGFIEPLEASAIVMIELSLRALTANFPVRRGFMPLHAERFNRLFHYRWENILAFLKLHYVLGRRTEPYWQAQRDPQSYPERLATLLQLWRDRPPSTADFPEMDEIFPAASQQYIVYGMGYALPASVETARADDVRDILSDIAYKGRALMSALPTNRGYMDLLAESRSDGAGRNGESA